MLQKFFKKWREVKSITFGQTLSSFEQGKAVWNDWNTEKAINDGYKANTYVYSCINLISRSTASVPWKVYRKDAGGQWHEIEGHPLQQLIERPNPYMSKKDFIQRMTSHLYLGGNAIFSKVRANGAVVELWNIPPDRVKPVPDSRKFIKHYLYDYNGKKFEIDTNDIIHNMFIDPGNVYWGLSPLQAGAKIVDTDNQAVNFNKVALQNRAITDGVFTFGQNLTRQQWEEARTMIREQHQGSENARQPWVLGSDAKWQQMSLSPAEMDFIESRRFSRSEICSIFQVPPPMVSIYDQATLSNIETARRIFWLDTVIPYLEDIKDCLNLSLTREFGEDIVLDYDVSNIEAIQENFQEKINNARALWAMGVPFNRINQKLELGFDEIEGGDTGFIPSGVVPTNLTFFDEPAPAEEEEGEKKFTPSSHKQRLNINAGLNLKTEEQKAFYWKRFEKGRHEWYMRTTRKTQRVIKDEGEKVIKAFEKDGLDGALKAIDKNGEQWSSMLSGTWTSIVQEVGKETYDQLKGGMKIFSTKDEDEDFFNPWEATIQRYINRTTGDKIKLIQQFSKEQVKRVVEQARSHEDPAERTIDKIAKAIKARYEDDVRYRSYRIARTEVVGASNFASHTSAEQLQENHNIQLKREWISSRDDRVRDGSSGSANHETMDGEVVGMDEYFSNGVLYPGDYMADEPSETINCRCVVGYVQE